MRILNLFLKKKGGGLRILFSSKKFQTQIMSNILKTENINTINTTKRISHIYWHNGRFFFWLKENISHCKEEFLFKCFSILVQIRTMEVRQTSFSKTFLGGVWGGVIIFFNWTYLWHSIVSKNPLEDHQRPPDDDIIADILHDGCRFPGNQCQ